MRVFTLLVILGLAGVYGFETVTGRSILPGRVDWDEDRVRINGAVRAMICVVVLLIGLFA